MSLASVSPRRPLWRRLSRRVPLPEELRGRPALTAYIATLTFAASFALAAAIPRIDFGLLGPVLLFGALGIAGSLTKINLGAVSRHDVAAFPNMLAVILLPAPEVVVVAMIGALGGELILRRPWIRLFFNVSQLTIVYALTSAVWAYTGGAPTNAAALLDDLPLLAISLGVRLLANNLLVAGVATLATDRPLWTSLSHDLATWPVELGFSSIGALAAFAWLYDPRALSLLLVPALMAWGALHGVAALDRSARRWAALAEISATLAAPASSATMLQAAAELVCRFGADVVRIEALGHTAIATREGLLPSDAARFTATLANPASAGATMSVLVPLSSNGTIFGEMRVVRLPSGIPADEPLFDAVAERIAGAIHNALLVQEAAQVETLRAVSAAKSDLLTAISHELHPPLALVVANAESITRRTDDADTRTRASSITATGQHLTRLVNDLLDTAHLETGRYALTRRPVDLHPLAQSAVDAARAAYPETRFNLEPPPAPISVDADPARLLQVFGNLLTNAARHGRPSGTIRVIVDADDHAARIAVEDDGPGIPEPDRERVFERFFRGSTTSPGLGLGLSIARDLVVAQGGTIRVEDAPTGGARFVVHLPR